MQTRTKNMCNAMFIGKFVALNIYAVKENKPVVSIHNGILCSHEEERNVIIRW
jgi:hypothetical protein